MLKRYGLSLNWPILSHRLVGDVDIYLWNDNDNSVPVWKRGDELIEKELGIKVEDGHEHHTVFQFEGMTVENHYDIINTKGHRSSVWIEEKLKVLATLCQQSMVDGQQIYLPSANFNAIFLIRHLGQHFAGGKVTLR